MDGPMDLEKIPTLDLTNAMCKGNAKWCERYDITLAQRNAYIEEERSAVTMCGWDWSGVYEVYVSLRSSKNELADI